MEQFKTGNKLVLAIMALWAGFVFYNIGAKALWLDEILVPLTSGHSLRYILERSLATDFHPPGYYILIKGLMAINDSDAFLRSFSAICGLSAIYVIYKVGAAFWSHTTGVLSATFMATNVFFISISRQVRPYSFLVLLYSLCLYGYLTSKNDPKKIRILIGCLCIAPLIHYSSLLVSFSFLILAAFDRPTTRHTLKNHKMLFSLCTLSHLASLYLLYCRRGETSFQGTFWETATNIANNTNYLFSSNWALNLFTLFLVIMIAVGFIAVYRKSRTFFSLFVIYTATPISIIMAMRYSSYSNPWHYIYILPAAACLTAASVSAIHRFKPMPAILCCALLSIHCISTLFEQRQKFYEDEQWSFKSISHAIDSQLEITNSLVFSEKLVFNATSRYIIANRDNYYRQKLDQDRVSTSVVSIGKDIPQDFGSGWAPLLHIPDAYKTTIPSTKEIDLSDQPEYLQIQFSPQSFFAQVLSSEFIQVDPTFGSKLIATVNNTPASFTYRLTNHSGTYPYAACFVIEYEIDNPGSSLTVASNVDGKRLTRIFSTGSVKGRQKTPLYMVFDAPFDYVDLTFTIICADGSPQYPGGNLDTVNIRGITSYFSCYKK